MHIKKIQRLMAAASISLSVSAALMAPGIASAQGTLRIGMTLADIPLTTGQTDQGGEGQRFMGYTVYDALVNWDLTSADKASGSGSGDGVEGRRRRQDQVGLQAAPRRQVP